MSLIQFSAGPNAARTVAGAPLNYVDPENALVAIVDGGGSGMSLSAYVSRHRTALEATLAVTGGLLFRRFRVETPLSFRDAVRAFGVPPLRYLERAAVRREIVEGIFTSTEFSSSAWIDVHHELSFARSIPQRIFFFAQEIATTGGETPIADEVRATQMVDKSLLEELLARGLLYTRNFRPEIDMDWPSAFQTQRRQDVEAYCLENGIEWTWVSETHLRTTQRQEAFVRNPVSGHLLCCNHAHIFHPAAMHDVLREALLTEYGPIGLPRNVTFGDGAVIPDTAIHHLRGVYETCRVVFPWRVGDVLLLDNVRCLHGRAPFTGSRTTLVSMTGLTERNVR